MTRTGESGPPPRGTAGWQLVLVALALAIFVINVVFPGLVVGIGFTGLMGFICAGFVLETLGALATGVFEGTAQLSIIFLGMTLIAFVAATSWNGFQRLAGRTAPPPLLLRWPWLLLGLLLFIACALTLPARVGRSALPVLPGAFVIAFTVWSVISVSVFLVRMSLGVLQHSWRLAKRSPFGAGILTLGAIAASLAVVPLAKSLVSGLPRAPAPQASRCDDLSWECTRQAILASRQAYPGPAWASKEGPSSNAVAFASYGATQAEVELNALACLEQQFNLHDMMPKARRIAQGIIQSDAEAEDLIHAVLMNICLRKKAPPRDFEPYFLKAVRNSATKRFVRLSRACPLDSQPEPECHLRPEDEFISMESHEALRNAFCTLSEEHQEVLRLRYFEELDEAEIGRQLEITHAAARKRVQRARDILRTEFLQRCQ
ncbi:sigma-70 family RNA polymerase sigma factor [Myxococcus faecalis]|uniref:sigma-70 family RNA polymerase sigma factor n=1 Tax=Myxococcus faecalis TaxID=3115646 RepID=UPI003CFA04CC